MKEPLTVAGVAALALAIIAGAVFGLGDRETFTSPPEAIAEDFVRALSTGRYDVAMKYVDPRAGVSRADIRTWSDDLRAKAGGIENVDVPAVSMQGDSADAIYEVSGTKETVTGQLRLTFDKTWQITR